MQKHISLFITALMALLVTMSSAQADNYSNNANYDYLSFRYDRALKEDPRYMNFVLNNLGSMRWKYIYATDYFLHSNTSWHDPNPNNWWSNGMYFEYDGQYHHYQTQLVDSPEDLIYWVNLCGINGWEYISRLGNLLIFELTHQPADYFIVSFDFFTNEDEIHQVMADFGQAGLQFVDQYAFEDPSPTWNKNRYLTIFKQVGRTVIHAPAASNPAYGIDLSDALNSMGPAGNRYLGMLRAPNVEISDRRVSRSLPIFEAVGYPMEYKTEFISYNPDLGNLWEVRQKQRTDGFRLIENNINDHRMILERTP